MKKFLPLFLALLTVLSFCSCGTESGTDEATEAAENVSSEESTSETDTTEEDITDDEDEIDTTEEDIVDDYELEDTYAWINEDTSIETDDSYYFLPRGKKVRVLIDDGDLLKIDLGNDEAEFISERYLADSFAECFYEYEYAEPDIYASCYGTYYAEVDDEYKGDPLRMRTGPSKDYELITEVPDGTGTVRIIGYNSEYTWAFVYIGELDQAGWVLLKYLHEIDGVGDKPVLYLYPEEETDVDVKVNLKNMQFSCTYPEYNNGWSVTAKPDGTLINKADGNEYSYLYWELEGNQNYDFSKGFVVKGSDTADFLRSTLAEMGLTPREYNEFIVYWLPKMQNNAYNLISFQTDAYTDNCQLDISPEPDSTLRVFMAYKALDKKISIEPQTFTGFDRNGFVAVEWGGAEVKL